MGMGASVFFCGVVFLSERVRWRTPVRALLTAGACALFAIVLTLENCTFVGVRFDLSSSGGLLLRTPDSAVLVLGEGRLRDCEDFLNKTYGFKLDAVLVLAEDEAAVLNHAAFLDTEKIYACDEVATGLRREICFEREGEAGGVGFRYVRRDVLLLEAEGKTVEVSASPSPLLGADLFLYLGAGRLKFSLCDGIMVT